MYNIIEVIESGCPYDEYISPNGEYKRFDFDGYREYWHAYKDKKSFAVNLLNIETFEKRVYPIVDICCKEKPVSWLKKFWWSGWRDDLLYDVSIKVLDMKEVTFVTMRSGRRFYIDESVECLENALDVSAWTADIRDTMSKV